jgi:hypothetical protein
VRIRCGVFAVVLCVGAVCCRPDISLPMQSVNVGVVGRCVRGCVEVGLHLGRPPDESCCSGHAGLQ